MCSPSPSRCREELVWSQSEDGRRSTNEVYVAQHKGITTATPRVTEVLDQGNMAVAEFGRKREPRPKHNLIETSCILHMQNTTNCCVVRLTVRRGRCWMDGDGRMPFATKSSVLRGLQVYCKRPSTTSLLVVSCSKEYLSQVHRYHMRISR